MSEDSDLPTKLGSVIPSLYYDLIARVCAGVPLLALLFRQQPKLFAPLGNSPWVAFLLLLGAGYIAGLLLTPFSLVWNFPLLSFFNTRFGLPKAFIAIKRSKAKTPASESGTALMSTRNESRRRHKSSSWCDAREDASRGHPLQEPNDRLCTVGRCQSLGAS